MKQQLLKGNLLLYLILVLGGFLRLFKLSSLSPFISDQGWFYISARDMLLTHHVPLVGITSSHTWLHQGALWTYVLAIILALFKFNPLIPAYFIALLGIVTIYLVYKLGSEMFSRRVGLIVSFFYATSPIVIYDSRFSYHTSPIPFFVALLIYFTFKLLKGNPKYFPLICLTLGLLYNLEIATFSVIATFITIFLFGAVKKEKWARSVLDRKILILSAFAILIPMVPMLLYDLHHGFPQTVKFVIWIFYKIAVLFGYPARHPEIPGETWHTFYTFNVDLLRLFVFAKSQLVSIVLLGLSYTLLAYQTSKNFKSRKTDLSRVIIFLYFTIPFIAFVSTKTNSGAYLLMFYPQAIILLALFFDFFMRKRYLFVPALLLLVFICLSNTYLLLSNNYFSSNNYEDRLNVSKNIIKESNGRKYNILGRGNGSQYESFVTPYEYLTWYLGHGPSSKNEKMKFYVTEYPDRIKLEKK